MVAGERGDGLRQNVEDLPDFRVAEDGRRREADDALGVERVVEDEAALQGFEHQFAGQFERSRECLGEPGILGVIGQLSYVVAFLGCFVKLTYRIVESASRKRNSLEHPCAVQHAAGCSVVNRVQHIVGGGSENCCALRMLAPGLGVRGIKTAVVEHVVGCGGLPCPPTVIGLGLGGGADQALKLGKLALLRPLGRRHPEPEMAELEAELEDLINATGVGPMGLGGRTTVLAVHAEYAHRHPASLPVGIVTQCWAHRRAVVRVKADGTASVD